jgi:hypothetical protein
MVWPEAGMIVATTIARTHALRVLWGKGFMGVLTKIS